MHGDEYRGGRGWRQRPPAPASLVAMRSTSLRSGAAAAAALALAVLALSAGAGAASSCTASIDPGTATPGDLLLAVTGAPDRALAAGIHFDGGTGRPLVVRADGDAWSRIPIPVRPGA